MSETNEKPEELFSQLCEDLKLDTQRSPWVQKIGLEGMLRRLVSEASEAQMTMESFNADELSKELGDVLWTWIDSVFMAEERTGEPSI